MAVTSKLAQKFQAPTSLTPDGTTQQATTVVGQAPKPVTPDTSLAGTAGQAGLPQTPMMPGTAASLGASPDASKMAGTPAAQAASVSRAAPKAPTSTTADTPAEPAEYKPAASTPKTLAEADKGAAANAERVQTEDQAKRQARSQQMQEAYGDIGLKVADLINLAIPKAVVPGTVYSVNELPGNLASAKPALDAYAANPADPKALSAAQQAIFNATGVFPPADSVKDQYMTDVSGGQAVANRTPDQIALTPDILQQIGISPEDAKLLGLPDDTSKLTVADISAALARAQAQGASSMSDLAAVAQTEGGATGRAAARDVNKAAASEELSTEIATNQVLDAVQEGQSLNIGGIDYKIEDLLNDEKITDLVDQYLASPEGSPLRKQLDAQMPSLAKFAQDNQAALKQGRAAAESTAGTVGKNQTANQAVRDKLATSLGMDDKAVRAELEGLVPELADQFSTEAGNLDKVGLFSVLSDPAKYGFSSGRAILDKAKQLKAADPEAFKAFAQMSPGEVQATGILSPDSEESAASWKDFIEAVNEQEQVRTLPPEDLQKYFFGTGDLKSVWNTSRAKMGAGDRADFDRLQPIMDANSDGKLDNEADINDRLKATAAQASPTDLVKQLGAGTKVTAGKKKVGGGASEATGLAKTVSGFLDNDGRVDASEVASLDPNTSALELEQLYATVDKGDVPARKALREKILKSKDVAVDRIFDSMGFEGPLKDAVYRATYGLGAPEQAATEKVYRNGQWEAAKTEDAVQLRTEKERLQATQALDALKKTLESPRIAETANVANLNRTKAYLERLLAGPAARDNSKANSKGFTGDLKNAVGGLGKQAVKEFVTKPTETTTKLGKKLLGR